MLVIHTGLSWLDADGTRDTQQDVTPLDSEWPQRKVTVKNRDNDVTMH